MIQSKLRILLAEQAAIVKEHECTVKRLELEIKTLSSDRNELNATKSELTTNNLQLTNEIRDRTELIHSLEEDYNNAEAIVSNKMNECKQIDDNIKTRKDNLIEMNKQATQLTGLLNILKADMKNASYELKDKEKKLYDAVKSIEKLLLNSEKEKIDWNKAKELYNKEKEGRENALNKLKLHLEEKEGNCSRLETWNAEEREKLRIAKAELEKVHGKILKHIYL